MPMPKILRFTRREAWQTLDAAHTGIFTSPRRDGVPIALPVWFVVTGERVYVSGPAHRKRFARVRRDPRVSFWSNRGNAGRSCAACTSLAAIEILPDDRMLSWDNARLELPE